MLGTQPDVVVLCLNVNDESFIISKTLSSSYQYKHQQPNYSGGGQSPSNSNQGRNGSGKTTFIKLLLGLYEPDKGRIEYQYPNQEIVDTSQLFSVLLQDFRTFALTISENIALIKELDEEELRRRDEAVRFSGLDEKISQLPDGIDTELTGEFSDSGITFSGGETQKLAIARAYMMDRPVLIMDEPSSNLDPISENQLIHRINQLAKNKGVILITHNMSYAKNVDLVIVFHEGRIVEYGAPDELQERKGYFYSMVEEQRKAEGGSIESYESDRVENLYHAQHDQEL